MSGAWLPSVREPRGSAGTDRARSRFTDDRVILFAWALEMGMCQLGAGTSAPGGPRAGRLSSSDEVSMGIVAGGASTAMIILTVACGRPAVNSERVITRVTQRRAHCGFAGIQC